MFHWLSDSAEVDAGWAKAGIVCVSRPIYENKYYKDKKEITREQAYKMA